MHKKRWYVLAGSAALIIFIGSAVNTTWLAESVVSQVFGTRQGVVVRRVHIDQQKFSLPGRMQFEKIDLALEVNGKLLMVEMPRVAVTGLQTFWSADRRILAAAQSMLVRYGPGQAKEVKVDLTIDRDGVSGPLTAAAGNWDKLQMKNISAFLVVNASGVELRALKCDAYGGKITGKIFVDTTPAKKAGAYAAELFIEAIDMVRLAELNPEIAVQLNGSVTGAVKLEGDPASLRAVDTDLNMPSGGKVSASLLAALTQYLPQSQEKKQLDLLIRKGGKVALEAFSFTMKGGEAGKFAGEICLRSREINLELNLAHDINTDGTIESLFGYWSKFLQ